MRNRSFWILLAFFIISVAAADEAEAAVATELENVEESGAVTEEEE